MTRQFNHKPQKNSRPPSPHRYAEEQSSSPARPRLNRAVVDRGWEKGSPRHHADYHSRTDNGQGSQHIRRKQQEAENSAYDGPTSNRSHGNRRTQYSKPSATHAAPPHRSFHQQGDTPHRSNDRQGQQQHQRPTQGGPSHFSDQQHRQGRSDAYSQNRRPSSSDGYQNNRRPSSRGYSTHYSPHYAERNDDKTLQSSNDERHPRLRSRPPMLQSRSPYREADQAQETTPYKEHFKSNYEQERFRSVKQAQSVNPKRRADREPNGYISQRRRKEAEFRTHLNEDTEALIKPVRTSQDKHHETHQETALPLNSSTEHRKEASYKKVRSGNERKTRNADVSSSTSKGPRPSQRGYKWPQS